MIWNFIDSMTKLIWQLYLIDWNFYVFLNNFELNVETIILNTITTPFVFMLTGLIIGGYLLLKSFRMTEEKFRLNKLGYFTYLIVYPLIMMAFWLTAVVFEIFRVKRKW
jgi:predicted transporter